jgi:prevent-host-death family protein
MGLSLDNSHLNGYLRPMADYSIADAKNNLPKLVDRALAGEDVTITRRGKPVARLSSAVEEAPASPSPSGPKSPYDVEWIRRHRVTPTVRIEDGDLVRQMRDEYRY